MSTFHEPDFPNLLICHRCRLVHDETGGWMSKQTYRETTGIDPVTCRLTHTYCPFCSARAPVVSAGHVSHTNRSYEVEDQPTQCLTVSKDRPGPIYRSDG